VSTSVIITTDDWSRPGLIQDRFMAGFTRISAGPRIGRFPDAWPFGCWS